MSVALAGRVEAAVDALDDGARKALAMRERDGADYRAIAEALGTGREGVADLIVSARLSVSSHLHGEAPPVRRTPQCGPARRVLAAQADGEAVGPNDLGRAREHLTGCKPCQAARLALREAELACRAWSTNPAPTVPAPTKRAATVPVTGSTAARLRRTGSKAAQFGRRRLVAAALTLVLLVAILAAALGGSEPTPPPAAPQPGPGSAQGSGADVVDPPGDKFCPAEQPDCK